MGLVAWYPLNGNTNDYSFLSASPGIVTGATNNSSGKIGSCYNFDGTGQWILSQNNLELYNVSLCAWIYPTSHEWLEGIVSLHDHSAPSNFGLNLTGGKLNISIGYSDGSREYAGKPSNTTVPLNTWSHVLVLCDYNNKTIKYYLNGNFDGQYTISKDIKITSTKLCIGNWSLTFLNASYDFIGRINDVRVYNHILSEKEIKEIAKAKILHYTFDDFQEPTTNLVPSIVTASYSYWGTNSGTSTIFTAPTGRNGVYLNVTSFTDGGVNWYNSGGQFNASASTKYTVSATVKSSVAFSQNLFYIRQYNSVGTQVSEYGIYSSSNKRILGDGWYRTYATFTTTADCSTFLVQGYQYSLGQFWVYDLQVEKKSYDTEFILPLQSRVGIVNDQSGLKNNATLTVETTPQWVSDSKIGSGTYKFNGTQNITTSQLFYDNINQCHTVSAWVYPTNPSAIENQQLINFNLGYRFYHSAGGQSLMYNNSGVNDHYVYGSTIPANQWRLVTWVYDKQNLICKVYYNGLLNATSSNMNETDLPSGFLSSTIFGSNFYGYIDDVRVYATALSDTDILELYQTRASIDNIGNLFTTEIIQDLSSYSSEYKANNLVINGSAQLGNKTNFSGFNDYINTDGYDDLNCFKSINLYSTTLSDNLIKINKNDTYYLSGYFKSVGSAGLSPLYFGGYCIDKNGNFIEHHMVNHYFSTRTTLAADLVNGATTVQLTSSANWIMDNPGSQQWNKLICFWHSGNEYPIYTYTRLSLDFISISGNTVTLLNPWSSGTIPAGTPVANSYHGGTFSYWAAGYYQVPTTWSRATATITGWGVNEEYKFRYGTEYIRIMFLTNYASGDYQTLIDKVEFFNLTSYQSLPINQGVKSNSILYSSKISELGITNGLIAYYPFDKDARDYSGNGRHGVINGNPVLASGIKNLAYNFNGTSDFISIDKSFPDPGIDNFTYSIWFYSPTLRSGEVFGKRATANIEMQISSNGAIYTYLSDTVGTTYSSTLYYSASTWYHYCITRSGTQVIIYLNGQNQANITLPANFNISPSTSNLEIARDPGNSGEYFHGNVDEFRVYNRSLSQEEISILYETTAPSTAAMKITKDTVYVKNEIKEVY